MLHPDPVKRTTSERVRRNRWVQGLTASWNVLDGIDGRLEKFWKKEFRNGIFKKFGSVVTDEQLRAVFTQIDEDGNGNIELEELAKGNFIMPLLQFSRVRGLRHIFGSSLFVDFSSSGKWKAIEGN